MKVAAWLPTFTDFPPEERVPRLIAFAQRAEELGFSSLWAVDHLLRITPNPTYSGLAWLDPLLSLSFVASYVSIPLGTIYCGCLRNPALVTKQISTLMYLASSEIIIAPVLGWYGKEHELAGFSRGERGRRTDEWLEVMELLMTQENVSYEGPFHSFEDVTIDPVPGRLPTIWATGGGAYYEDDARQDEASIKPVVIDRILRYQAWCVSAQSSPTKAAADWQRVRRVAEGRGIRPDDIYVSHTNFMHVVETSDRGEAYAKQAPLWNSRSAHGESFEELSEKIYLSGTIEDIVRKLKRRVDAFGMREFLALSHPGHERTQLELWGKHILPAVAEM